MDPMGFSKTTFFWKRGKGGFRDPKNPYPTVQSERESKLDESFPHEFKSNSRTANKNQPDPI